jgi:hypothetical protein
MGIGAVAGIVGAVGALASAGTSIYGAATAGSPQQAGAGMSGTIKKLANQYLAPFMDPSAWNLNIPGMANQSIQFGLNAAPQINQANMQQLTQMLNQVIPGYQGMMGTAATNTQALLKGQLPQDVIDQIQRSTAFQAMRGGFAGTGAGHALTARDLGLTSLQLQGQGQQQMGNLIQLARGYLMPQPVNPLSLLPLGDLIQGNEWSKTQQYNATANYVNMRAQGAAALFGMPNQSNVPAIGGGINTALGALLGQNPQGGGGLISSLGKLFQGSGTGTDPDPDQPYLDYYSGYTAAGGS